MRRQIMLDIRKRDLVTDVPKEHSYKEMSL